MDAKNFERSLEMMINETVNNLKIRILQNIIHCISQF